MSGLVASLGPLGVFLLMVPESACIPVPSEVTLMSAGFGVHQGWFGFPAAVTAATAGNLVGSVAAYWLGRSGVIERLPGRLAAGLAGGDGLFARRGELAVFVGRLLPLVRSFISVPAGRARVPLATFALLTVLGCALWSTAFVLAGIAAGTGWRAVAASVGRGGLLLGAVIALAAVGRTRIRR